MPTITTDMFSILQDEHATGVSVRLYKDALKQDISVLLHFLPKALKILSKKGTEWKGEDECYFDDKYIPIHPVQGNFLYMQARALNVKTIIEFGTSYGISAIYLSMWSFWKEMHAKR